VTGDVRAARRRERRRAQVRRTALLLAVLGLVALALAVWLAWDAPDTTALGSGARG
jgi:cytochrome c-type biogenesis protein CcmH/NrfG